MSADEFATYIHDEMVVMAKVVKDTGAKVE